MGIATIGQRLAILKAVYNVKLIQNIPIEPDHYVPPCASSSSTLIETYLTPAVAEVEDRHEYLSVERLYDLLKDQGLSSQPLCPFDTHTP